MLTAGVWVAAAAIVALAIVVWIRLRPQAVSTRAVVPAERDARGGREAAAGRVHAPRSSGAGAPTTTVGAKTRLAAPETLEAIPPDRLPRFADVGGFDALKQELRTTVELLLDRTGVAQTYRIEWNGVLLHGPPGVGKTLLARATAGELELAFVYVATADAVSKWIGEGPARIDHAFTFASQHAPCLLFFDEFDSLASRRESDEHLEYRRLTNQLLASLEEHHGTPGLVVMAATNTFAELDPAVIRPGRFDRIIEIGLPDVEARRAIFGVHLRGRPLDTDVNVDDLALLTEGCTGAAIESAIDAAAVETAGKAVKVGATVPISQRALLDHLEPLLQSGTATTVI
jgi:SpoVK/Ycf46/Vps4 family AAA+-type ATPase